MARDGEARRISRRTLLVGGGAAVGLALVWGAWPRSYEPNLRVAPDETLFGAFLKIGSDGRIVVAVPQAELGQGVYTSLPQILADELGADWRTVSVEPAPISPLYANLFLANGAAEGALPSVLRGIGTWTAKEYASRSALMVTGGSSSVRAFEAGLREAGAGARALLSKAAAARWDVEWETLDTVLGFVINGSERISFAELAVEASLQDLPEFMPVRGGVENRLLGQSAPRLDLPSKVDGSARFAGDVRLPDMVFASVRSAPPQGGRLRKVDRKAAFAIPGVLSVFENEGWVAAAGTNWWAANRGLEALNPVFETQGGASTTESIEEALVEALDKGEGKRVFATGDVAAAYAGGTIHRARYGAGPAASAAMETLTATARYKGGTLEVWAAVQAPSLARAAAAKAAGLSESRVVLYPMLGGGGYGRKLETIAIEQAVTMAVKMKRPVQLVYSRTEETVQDGFRAPAFAELSARLGDGGRILAWQARIAAPNSNEEAADRLGAAGRLLATSPSEGAVPPYAIPAIAVDHLPAEIGIRTGIWRSGSHSSTAFFTECFIDELARIANVEPFSFRMQMLGDNPRLARCLSTAATIGGWDGGVAGGRMGIAAHSAYGSHIATLVEAEIDRSQRVRVIRAVAAVDCGRVVNPDIVRQQVEGGLLFGIAAATGNPITFDNGRPTIVNFGGLGFPRLAGSPEVTVEILPSEDPPGGVTELGVPTAAPAVANALYAATGTRLRQLPLVPGSAA
jgi:isoquinoline 1-oxidoreductase beta subunit